MNIAYRPGRIFLLSLLASAAAAAIAAGCGGGGGPAPQGGERQSCYPNGTCNAGLVCLSAVCVNPGAGGAGGQSGTGGSGARGGTSGAAGTAGSNGGSVAGTGGASGGTSGAAGTGGGAGAGGGGAAGGSAGTGGSAAGTGGTSGTGGAGGTGGASGTGGGAGTGGNAGRGGGGGATGGSGAGGTGGGSACPAPATYGNLGSIMTPSATKTAASDISWSAPIGSAQPPQFLAIELFNDTGVFSPTVRTGTFSLTGAEAQYATCGLCVRVQVVPQGAAVASYMATGGVASLTSVSGRLTGTLTNVTLQHVNISEFTFISTPHPDGCVTAVDQLTFDFPITNQ